MNFHFIKPSLSVLLVCTGIIHNYWELCVITGFSTFTRNIYIYTYTHIYTHIYTYIYIYIYTYIHTYGVCVAAGVCVAGYILFNFKRYQ